MKNIYKKTWFTLVEMMVALTILSIIMVSVMMIFYLVSQISSRVELHRFMQENVKNTFDIIAEDVRTWSIDWVRWFGVMNCQNSHQAKNHILCLSRWLRKIEISIWEKDNDAWKLVSSDSYCWDISSQCYVIKREQILDSNTWNLVFTDWYPLTNSKSHITTLNFQFLGPEYPGNIRHPRILLTLWIRPAFWQWMAYNLIEAQEIIVQTTLSERFIQQF